MIKLFLPDHGQHRHRSGHTEAQARRRAARAGCQALGQAELRTKDRQPLTLNYWHQNVDRLLSFNDKPILQGSGKLSNERAKQITHERYDNFNAQRRLAEVQAADAEDLKALEALAKKGKHS